MVVRARIDSTEEGFEWIDKSFYSGLMLILILPPDYVYIFPSDNNRGPRPFRFKPTKSGRLAFYWWLAGGQRTVVTWDMQHAPGKDIESLCQSLNEQARRARPTDVLPVHIDSSSSPNSIPSTTSPAIVEPPPWHINQVNVYVGATTSSMMTDTHKGGIPVDPVSIITLISSGLKLVDQFRELAIRFHGQAPKPPSGKAEQVGTALEVRYGGQVTQKVEANQLHMDQWDERRYDALSKRIRTSWDIFNDLFASEAGASPQEGARIRADMRKTQDTLCVDFREMVSLYERALGASLPDHYQLFEVCEN
jgi:hypothetical protein